MQPSLQIKELKIRITSSLRESGPKTAAQLAEELESPPGNVQFALEQLREQEANVKRLAFGFWDLGDNKAA